MEGSDASSRYVMREPDVELAAETIRCLANATASGETIRNAVTSWWRIAPPKARGDLRRVAGSVALGAKPATAVAKVTRLFGPHAPSLGALLGMSERLGSDPARLLAGLAADIEAAEAATSHARSLVAGAVLSARIVGALPLLTLPLLPSSISRSGAAGLAATAAGIALCVIGVLWLKRLAPQPAPADPISLITDCAALACDAGVPLDRAFDALASGRIPEIGGELMRLKRLARLGPGWSGALVWSDDERLVSLGRSLRVALRNGASCSVVLREHARRSRLSAARAAERSARRAPVAMVPPLTLCLLPGFTLLLIVPFAGAVAS
jgi:Flp pilus assembly protein TadB